LKPVAENPHSWIWGKHNKIKERKEKLLYGFWLHWQGLTAKGACIALFEAMNRKMSKIYYRRVLAKLPKC
jgi:hypothetical protein